MLSLIATNEFQDWIRHETPRSRYQIDGRLAKIRLDDCFGNHKSLLHEEKRSLILIILPSSDKIYSSSCQYLQTAYPKWHISCIENIADGLAMLFHNEETSREHLREGIIQFEATIEGPRDDLPDLVKMLEKAVLSSTNQGIYARITSCVIL